MNTCNSIMQSTIHTSRCDR